MKTKDILINNLHKIIRKDEFINAILNPVGLHLDEVKDKMILLEKEFLFSSMSLERIQELEKELDYKTKATTIEGKRIEIEARWKTTGKCDLELLQTIANTWKPETVTIKFINGDIQVDFLGGINGDFDLIGLRNALDEAKPAHLWLDLTFEEQQATKMYFKTYNTEEIEEDFIEKNKVITEVGKHNYGSWQEVVEIYGI